MKQVAEGNVQKVAVGTAWATGSSVVNVQKVVVETV